ncbi:uncharacterized protein F4807DRAFT_444526 [Annulohypoxylon truncatum]|uniref:uncharacterized protein n=1 Tax=Annulohypoxylon truncatum TaxID=327061 RepID=UPI0020078032|nr:uncharacterized protein F4807DRAFT_444526 [Annulohypoxylon truncatum]KAI1205088.1 hypothetical protein F4807DRAFT_444526 [Annulohypoxylon truncatum]
MSMRSKFSVMVSSGGRTPKTTYPSYGLEEYLRQPPASTIERVISNQKPATPRDREKEVKTELESWTSSFEKAGQSRHNDQGSGQ